MRYFQATVRENRSLGRHAYVLRLGGCEALQGAQPGQFVMLRGAWGADPLLPRAFSLLATCGKDEVEVLGKAVGKATRMLEGIGPGAPLSVLGPLGNRFPEPRERGVDLLVAGGVGLAPLLMQARLAATRGLADRTWLFYGGRNRDDLVLLDDIERTGVNVALATDDGSCGHAGRVTEALAVAIGGRVPSPTEPEPARLLACGPDPMLRAVARLARERTLEAYLSLEGEMACGIGICLACAVPCVSQPFRYTCKNGPVFSLTDLAGPYADGV